MSSLGKKLRRLWKSVFERPPLATTAENYDEYWEERKPVTLEKVGRCRRRRLAVIGQWIPPDSTILDVGCGDGITMQYLAQHASPKSLLGMDLSPKAVEFVRGLGLTAICGDLRDEEVRQKLGVHDHVIATEVVEHVAEAEALLRLLAGMARRSLVVSVPNTGYLTHRLRLLFGRFPVQWRIFPGEHVRFWTLSDFRWTVRSLGLRILRSVGYDGLPGRRVWPSLLASGIVFEIQGTASEPGQPA